MTKFSIVIPVYNVEKYIGKCLDSVFKQDYKNYEVIVVNDGSTDKSMDIVKKYDVKIVNSKHKGVSSSRNLGVKEATGEYLLFLDSDDYYEKGLLKKISKELEEGLDLLRFQVRNVYDDIENIDFNEKPFNKTTGEKAFNKIINYHYIESVWCYAIRRDYWIKEKFTFKEDTVHEDYGLMPLVIIKAKSVKSISFIGYNYYRRNGSIMNTPSYSWTKKKVKDFYEHYKYLIQEIETTNINSLYFKSFVSNSLILKICELKGKDYKKYKRLLKEEKVYENLLDDTVSRKIKKVALKCSPKLYYKIMKG